MTVSEALRWATGQLAQSSRESARLEAELIIAHVLQKARHELYLQPSHTLSRDEQTQLYELIERRGRGEPLQYLLEYTEFYGCLLRVTPAVLIPRPETEELVEFVLQSTPHPPKDVLDLGTGSGAIAIALARAWPESSLVATDISQEALALARENALRNGVAERIRFVQSDWFSQISGRFDLIVSNPPYVRTGYFAHAPRELLYEPRVALDGGPQGLDALRRIIHESPRYLRPGGSLYLEIGSDQGQAVRELSAQTGAFVSVEIRRDLSGQERFARLRLDRSPCRLRRQGVQSRRSLVDEICLSWCKYLSCSL